MYMLLGKMLNCNASSTIILPIQFNIQEETFLFEARERSTHPTPTEPNTHTINIETHLWLAYFVII